jgi:hypothetical protein
MLEQTVDDEELHVRRWSDSSLTIDLFLRLVDDDWTVVIIVILVDTLTCRVMISSMRRQY